MKFREHRGSLADSMTTIVWLWPQRSLLLRYINRLLAPFGIVTADEEMVIEPYAFDDRLGWHTHIVSLKHYGVVGFTDEMPT